MEQAIPQVKVMPRRRWRFGSWMKIREALVALLFLTPFLTYFTIFVGRAVYQSVYMSFFDWAVLRPRHKPEQPYVGLENYRELINDDLFRESLQHTFQFATITVIGSTILALACAMAVNNPMRGRTFFRALFYAPSLLSVAVIAIIWGWLMDNRFGIINAALVKLGFDRINWLGDADMIIFSMSLATIWWTFGFPMLIFLAGLQNIPEMLYEAGKIDGANSWQSFRYITLPLLRPTLLFVTVTGFISHIQVFGQPYIMTPGGPDGLGTASYTVIVYLYQTAWRYFRMGYGSAIAVGLTLVMVLLTLIQFALFGRNQEV